MKYFRILPKTHIDILGARKTFFVLSGLIMIACLISVVTKGLNFGIDFTGGTMVQVQFKDNINIDQVRSALNQKGIKADIQSFIGTNAFAVKVKGAQENVNEVSVNIQEGLKNTGVEFEIEQTDFVGPAVGNDLAKKAFFAFTIAMFAMILYIAFRFQSVIWGAMAVAALFHDVFLTVGVFSFFQLEVDLVIVAAFMTIAGFSINDTIVIFDRVRENMKLNPKWHIREWLNVSVNETLSRTIITSITVIGATAILYFMGGKVLNNFCLAILVGLTSGMYTSALLVPGLVYQWTKNGQFSLSAEKAPSNNGYQEPHLKSKKRNR
ncbi:MAG: protein translocase subunit SecF [Elusimicrobiaceae bacterium]|nr:protein translocase subunit SecF [Elusimicrobiaceae bacterium]